MTKKVFKKFFEAFFWTITNNFLYICFITFKCLSSILYSFAGPLRERLNYLLFTNVFIYVSYIFSHRNCWKFVFFSWVLLSDSFSYALPVFFLSLPVILERFSIVDVKLLKIWICWWHYFWQKKSLFCKIKEFWGYIRSG